MLRPERITIEGFQAFSEPQTLDLSKLSVAVVTGANGEGKSTIFNALEWAIFGTPRVAGDVDSVVNTGCDEAKVTLDFTTDGGRSGRIVRVRPFQKSPRLTLQFFDDEEGDWIDYSSHEQANAQQAIMDMVGMDKEVFSSLVHLDQRANGQSLFVRAKSADRRKILMSQIPDNGSWVKYEDESKALLSSHRTSVKVESAALESIRDDIEDVTTGIADTKTTIEAIGSRDHLEGRKSEIKRRIADIEKAMAAESAPVEELRSELADLSARRREANRLIASERREAQARVEQHERLDAQVKSLREEFDDLQGQAGDLEDELDRHDEALAEAKEQVEFVAEKLARAEQNHEERTERLTTLAARATVATERVETITNPCVLCGTDMDHETHERVIAQAQAEVETLDEQVEAATEAVGKSRKTLANTRKRHEAAADEVRRIERAITSGESRLDGLESSIESVKRRHGEAKAGRDEIPVDELVARIETLVPEDETEAEQMIRQRLETEEQTLEGGDELIRLRREIEAADKGMARLERAQGNLDSQNKQLARLRKRETETMDKISVSRDALDDLALLAKACSPKGAPSILIESVLQEIRDRQNTSLESLTEDGSKIADVSYSQSRPTRDGKGSRDELDIMVSLSDGTQRRMESLSPGEQTRVSLSNLFAMIEVFNAIHPGLVTWIALDEPFVHLDDSAIPVAMNILHDAVERGVVDMVLITSHQKQVIDSAKQEVKVGVGVEGFPEIRTVAP